MRFVLHYLNMFLAATMNYRVKKAYQKKLSALKRCRFAFFTRLDRKKEREYIRYWSRFGWKVSADWYRYNVNRSGLDLKTYVPNDVFYVIMDRVLNEPNEATFWANKVSFEKLYGSECFPETLVRIISEELYDRNYNELSLDDAALILNNSRSDIVVKVAEGSCGGHGVTFYDWKDGRFLHDEMVLNLSSLVKSKITYIIQKAMIQDNFTAQFNPSSVNTFRVVTLRRPGSGKVVVLKKILRMGVGSSRVDNQSSGGISVGIFDDGRLNKVAFNAEGDSFATHPTTGIRFDGIHFKRISSLDAYALSLSQGVPPLRFLSFDIMMCEDGSFKCLEVNPYGAQIDFLQTYCGGLFDPFTEEIVEYCLKNRKRSVFRHARGFYY